MFLVGTNVSFLLDYKKIIIFLIIIPNLKFSVKPHVAK